MDTSNSTTVLRPVDYFLGAKFDQKLFTQQDWERILSETFNDLKPRLKYLQSMKTVQDFLNYESNSLSLWTFSASRQHVLDITKIISDGKFMSICSIDENAVRSNKLHHAKDAPHDCFLLATSKGELFRLFILYKRMPGREGYKKVHHHLISFDVKPVYWSYLDLVKLSGRKRYGDLCVGATILEGLYVAIKKTIDVRQSRIDEMREVNQGIRQKMELLDVFSTRFIREDSEE